MSIAICKLCHMLNFLGFFSSTNSMI
jgi:hypothetical protein